MSASPAAPRVLALVSDGFGAPGGIAAYNRELLAALGDAGCAVRILARRGDGAAAPAGVVQERPRAARGAYAAASLARALRSPWEWVFCGHLHHAPLARAAAAVSGARLWLQLHGIEAWRRPGAGLRAGAGAACLVTAVSRMTRERFLRWSHVHASRVRVLGNAVRPEFTPGPADGALRRRLAPRGEPVVLTVSRLAAAERYKGHDVVLHALAALSGPRAPVYAIAGDGDDRPRLEALAVSLGIAQRVHFLGALPDAALPALYRSADVFAMPSTGEGFGVVFLEALACGLPVVAGDGDGARDALRDGHLGALVPARDARAVADAIAAAIATAPAHASRRMPPELAPYTRDGFRAQLRRILDGCGPVTGGERWR